MYRRGRILESGKELKVGLLGLYRDFWAEQYDLESGKELKDNAQGRLRIKKGETLESGKELKET